jgi:hypothetical protein
MRLLRVIGGHRTFTPFNSETLSPASPLFLVCHKTGTLPQIRHCRAGSVI